MAEESAEWPILGMVPGIYDLLRELRAAGPVVRVRLHGDVAAWLLTRPEDVAAAARDPQLISDDTKLSGYPGSGIPGTGNRSAIGTRTDELRSTVKFSIMAMDPPDHTRLRRLLAAAFTPGRVTALQPRIQAITDGLLDRIAALGRADIVQSLARPFRLRAADEPQGRPGRDGLTVARCATLVVGARTLAGKLHVRCTRFRS